MPKKREYETYDTSNGYGNPDEWRAAFNSVVQKEPDPYSVLNISRNSTKQEIKTAYRKLAFKYHPDKNSTSTQFSIISRAYKSLMHS